MLTHLDAKHVVPIVQLLGYLEDNIEILAVSNQSIPLRPSCSVGSAVRSIISLDDFYTKHDNILLHKGQVLRESCRFPSLKEGIGALAGLLI